MNLTVDSCWSKGKRRESSDVRKGRTSTSRNTGVVESMNSFTTSSASSTRRSFPTGLIAYP